LAPSETRYTPLSTRFSASLALISFWVAHGKAQSALWAHSVLMSFAGSTGVLMALEFLSAYSLTRPRFMFFSSSRKASLSRSKPASS